jgi:hypothetical protein
MYMRSHVAEHILLVLLIGRPAGRAAAGCWLLSNHLLAVQDNHHGVPCDFLIIEDEKEAVLNFKTGFKN